jgi:hypothetical protein
LYGAATKDQYYAMQMRTHDADVENGGSRDLTIEESKVKDTGTEAAEI